MFCLEVALASVRRPLVLEDYVLELVYFVYYQVLGGVLLVFLHLIDDAETVDFHELLHLVLEVGGHQVFVRAESVVPVAQQHGVAHQGFPELAVDLLDGLDGVEELLEESPPPELLKLASVSESEVLIF